MSRRPPRARRSSLRTLLTALLPVVLLPGALAGSLALAGPAAAQQSPSRSPSAGPSGQAVPGPAQDEAALPVTLTVDDLRPRAPRPGDDLQVVGTVRNTGDQPLRALQLRLRAGQDPLVTRGELRRADETARATVPRAVVDLPDLAPGATAPLDLRLAVDLLRMGPDGVYPVQLEVRGLRGDLRSRVQLGQVSTYLPWFGARTVDPLRIAWVWPLADAPRLTSREVLVDDGLATSLAPGGRLGSSLTASRAGLSGACPPAAQPDAARTAPAPAAAACRPVPVSYAVDPDLLHTAAVMSRGYEVPAEGGAQPGTGAAAATAWLEALRGAAAPGEVVALPYADPDVAAVSRRDPALADDVRTALDLGRDLTREVLGTEPLAGVAVPPAGTLPDTAYDALLGPGTRAVVLGEDAVVPPADGARSTPGARVALPSSADEQTVTGLVVDRGLSDLLVPAAPQDPRLAEQRWLVETAMIAAELPSRGRTLLVAAPRRGIVDPAVAGAAVRDTGAVPWMCGVRLGDVLAGQEGCPATQTTPSYEPERDAALARPDPRGAALSPDLVADVAEVRSSATQLTDAVVQEGTEQSAALRTRLQRGWLRGTSAAWREDRAGGLRLVRAAQADVAELRSKVSVVTGEVVTLTSKNGRVSVSVVNELDQPVTVALQLRAPTDARLSRAETGLLDVPALFSLPVQVDARTLTSGRYVVQAQLLDRDGVAFGEPRELLVRSTRYGAVALAVTGLAAAVLFVAVGVRLVRRALRRSRAA